MRVFGRGSTAKQPHSAVKGPSKRRDFAVPTNMLEFS
jgi:hypothetical protein